mmetsp:Transcript_18587/g.24269  ORF Transcript_18587/g.24269 Transcript_18587/m.24269 type:complete len:544 (-) Transcript_18587:385-2016(-)
MASIGEITAAMSEGSEKRKPRVSFSNSSDVLIPDVSFAEDESRELENSMNSKFGISVSENSSDSDTSESMKTDDPIPQRESSTPMNTSALHRYDSSILTEEERAQALARVSMEENTPVLTSPNRREQVSEFIIGGGDPLLNTRAKYSFNKYEMPEVRSEEVIEDEVRGVAVNKVLPGIIIRTALRFFERLKNFEKRITRFVAKLIVLLSRSSGRDKLAAFFQYGSMFWGNQPFVNVSGIKDGPEAPWRLLEDSMSSGRKVFRLFKWVKEYERARLALTVPDQYLGCVRTKARAIVTRILAILMHGFAGGYYFVDNMIWAAQIGFINRAAKAADMKTLFQQKVPYEEYVSFQSQFIQIQHQRELAQDRIDRWKDWKNWFSLQRLIFAIIHCLLQIDSLHTERHRLEVRYAERIAYSKAMAAASARSSASGSGSDMSVSDDGLPIKEAEDLEIEREGRLLDVRVAEFDTKRTLLACICNIAILLNRLKFEYFKKVPLWGVGLFGVVAALCGIHKNYPTKAPQAKVSKHLRDRSNSFENRQKAKAT